MLLTCYELNSQGERLFVTPDVGGKSIILEYTHKASSLPIHIFLEYEDAQDLKRLLYKWSMDIQAMENRDNV
jgi:hypothetical protein